MYKSICSCHINVSLHEPYLLDFFPHFFSMHIYVLTYNRGVFCKVDLRFHAACHINGSSLGGRHQAVWFRKSKRNYLKWGSVSMLIPIFFLHLFEEHGPLAVFGWKKSSMKKTTFLMEFNGRSLRMAVVKRWWIINHHRSRASWPALNIPNHRPMENRHGWNGLWSPWENVLSWLSNAKECYSVGHLLYSSQSVTLQAKKQKLFTQWLCILPTVFWSWLKSITPLHHQCIFIPANVPKSQQPWIDCALISKNQRASSA